MMTSAPTVDTQAETRALTNATTKARHAPSIPPAEGIRRACRQARPSITGDTARTVTVRQTLRLGDDRARP